jgi:hypothetical protein
VIFWDALLLNPLLHENAHLVENYVFCHGFLHEITVLVEKLMLESECARKSLELVVDA